MPESFMVRGPLRVQKAAEHPKINYQQERERSKKEQAHAEKSPFHKLMQEDRPKSQPLITAEKIWERILPTCRRYIIDYEGIVGLRWRNYPIDIFFRKGTLLQEIQEPSYLGLEDVHDASPVWQAMLRRCRGNAVLIHPRQWEKMNRDLEYAVMLAAETRSILARQYAENEAYPHQRCIGCVVGIDETGLAVRLFSVGENYKREMMPVEKLLSLRSSRAKRSDEELKRAFLEKLRQQKQTLEKYRYDTAMTRRLKTSSALFDKPPAQKEAAGRIKALQENEAAISLMELLNGKL